MLSLSAAALDYTLQPVPGGTFRFKDIGGQAFGAGYIGSYTYDTASVVVSLEDSSSLFLAGTVTARKLKPNFAYQVKLLGRPLSGASTDAERLAADDATNERLGRLGRWWRVSPNPGNTNDGDVDANKTRPGYVFEGYLIVGFFVTDPDGNATARFETRNSFHVLWRTNQRPASSIDGPVQNFTLPDTTANTAYDSAVAARPIELYAEQEPTRAAPGTLQLPLGAYRCNFLLTEESFHDSGTNAGNWAAAMRAPIEFSIPSSFNPSHSNPLDVDRLRASLNLKRSGGDNATLRGKLVLPESLALDGVEAAVNIMGVSRTFVLDRRGRGASDDGRLQLRRDRRDPTDVTFTLTLRRAAFVPFDAPGSTGSQATVNTTLTLKIGAETYLGAFEPRLKTNPNRARLSFRH